MLAPLDPYTLNDNNSRINKYHIANGGGLFRMTSANLNLNYKFSSKEVGGKKEKNELNEMESTSSGERDDDLFGMAEGFSDRRMNQEDQGEIPKYLNYK